MTEERLQAIEDWARAWSRANTQAGRVVLSLVAEVRRLKAASLPAKQSPLRDLESEYRNRKRVPEPAPVPPFRGVLDGMTAADVYGVHV